jgi:plastocyanin
MNIKKFYERNKPIFFIGGLMAIIFIILIVVYASKNTESTGLMETNEMDKEFYEVSYEESSEQNQTDNQYNRDENTKSNNETEESSNLTQQEIDERYGTLQIEYTEKGFRPGNIRIALGQEVSWTNKTDRVIYLHQRKETYSELKDKIEINPGESFSFRLTELGVWTYEESETGDYGRLEVKDPEDFPVPEKTYY